MTTIDPTAPSRQPSKFIKCPRCKRPIYVSNFVRHPAKCAQIPTPADLAAEFMSDKYITVNELQRRYPAGRNFLVSHLTAAGIPLDELSRNHLSGRKKDAPRQLTAAQVGPVCERCKIRLNHAEVPKGIQGFCGWCNDGN